MSKRTKVLAWHCIGPSLKLGYGDGRSIEAGKTLTVDGDVSLCRHGLHASLRLVDALSYAREGMVCRVELSGVVVHGDDKLVASRRSCLWIVDATPVLRLWACWCAERALKLARKVGREPDPRSWTAVAVARKYLSGDAQVDELIESQRAAADAASAAGAYAAYAAADAAYAYAAAYAAAAAAADAAYAAAAAAAGAYDAARNKENEAQNRKLETMVMALHKRRAA